MGAYGAGANDFKAHVKSKYDLEVPIKIYYNLKEESMENIDTNNLLNIALPKEGQEINVCSSNGVCASHIDVEYDE